MAVALQLEKQKVFSKTAELQVLGSLSSVGCGITAVWEAVSTPQLTRLISLLLRRTIRGCSLPAILIYEGSFNSQRGLRCWEVGDETAVADPGRAERPSADGRRSARGSSPHRPPHPTANGPHALWGWPPPTNHAALLLSRPRSSPHIPQTGPDHLSGLSSQNLPGDGCPPPPGLFPVLWTHRAHGPLRASGLLSSRKPRPPQFCMACSFT